MIAYLVHAWWFWPLFALACTSLAWAVEYRIGCDKAAQAWRDGYEAGCDDELASFAAIDPADRIIGDALSFEGIPQGDPACRDGIGSGRNSGRWCWRIEGHEPPHRDAFGREWADDLPPEPGKEWAAELAAMPHVPSDPEDLPRPGDHATIAEPTGTAHTGPGQPGERNSRCKPPATAIMTTSIQYAAATKERSALAAESAPPAMAAIATNSRLTPAQRRRARHKRRGPYRPLAHPAVLAAIAAQFTPPEPDDPWFWRDLAELAGAAYDFVDGWAAAV